MCETWCNIADVHEKAGHDYDDIKDSYLRALKFAELSGNQHAVVGFNCVYGPIFSLFSLMNVHQEL